MCRPSSKYQDFSQILNSNFWQFVSIVLSYLLMALVITISPKLVHANCRSHVKSLKLILFKAPFMDHNRFPRVHLRLMFLFFSLFLFFNLNFLSGNIKTEKVTIPTDQIVDSASKLIGTTKTLAMKSSEISFFKEAPENSFLNRLTRKNTFVLLYMSDFARMKAFGIHRYVIFAAELELAYVMTQLAEHGKHIGSVGYVKSTSYYEILLCYQMRRSLDEKRKRHIKRG